MKLRNKILKEFFKEVFEKGFRERCRKISREVWQKLLTASVLSFALISLSGCTSTATSQLKESPCKECTSKRPFYCNGVWLEEQPC